MKEFQISLQYSFLYHKGKTKQAIIARKNIYEANK